jgi:endopolyphosphatase
MSIAPAGGRQALNGAGRRQFFFPAVGTRKAGKAPVFKLEYTTFRRDALRPGNGTDPAGFVYPIPLAHLPRSLDAKPKKWTPYGMPDLTVGSWLKLARRLADEQEGRLRARFKTYMTVGVGAPEEEQDVEDAEDTEDDVTDGDRGGV